MCQALLSDGPGGSVPTVTHVGPGFRPPCPLFVPSAPVGPGNGNARASARESGRQNYRQFYLVAKRGGLPEKLPIPYGELAALSPDGGRLAYITRITEDYPFKRYRGGLTSDIILFDFATGTAEYITDRHANDGKPAWSGDTVFFLSDEGENMRINIWAYDTVTRTLEQVTNFEEFDISSGSSSIRTGSPSLMGNRRSMADRA